MFSVSYLCIRRVSMGLGPSPLGFFSSSVPVWTAFSYPLTRVRIPAASDYYAPSDSFKDLGVSFGLPLLYSPLPFSFLEGLPCSLPGTYLWMALRWRVHLRAPSPRSGPPASAAGRPVLPLVPATWRIQRRVSRRPLPTGLGVAM